MYAIAFDLDSNILKTEYGEPYELAYDEIRTELSIFGFIWIQEGMYLNTQKQNGLATVYQAIQTLSAIKWFTRSVRNIRGFKVEDWSDFTQIVKGE